MSQLRPDVVHTGGPSHVLARLAIVSSGMSPTLVAY